MLRKVKVFNSYYRKLFSHYSGSRFGYSMLMFFFINTSVFAQIYITESTTFYVADDVSIKSTLDSLAVDSHGEALKIDVYVQSDTKVVGLDKMTSVNLKIVEDNVNISEEDELKVQIAEKSILEKRPVEYHSPKKEEKKNEIVWNKHFPKSQFVSYTSFNNVPITVTKKHTEALDENNYYSVERIHIEISLNYFEASKYDLLLNSSIKIRPPPFGYNS